MPSLMSTLALAAATLSAPSMAAYSLTDNYQASQFFNMFSFWTEADPTHGYVDYITQQEASTSKLIQTNSGSVYMGVDMNNTASGSGRKSVRLSSKKTYDTGLFVIDVEHMPVGCGTWPAFWLVGPNWPNEGEIDIIEGVDVGTTNKATLHTSAGCSIKSGVQMTGSIDQNSCESSNGNNNGCGITSPSSQSYGTGLNAANGGVYATEVTKDTITIWFWPRSSIPSDVKGGNPNPSGWGKPFALFSGCDVSSHFKDMQIVFDTTFCGDWAGQAWTSDSQCSGKAATCQDYVQNHPEGFENAYWRVNSLQVFSGSSSGSSSGSGSESSPSPVSGGSGSGSGSSASKSHAVSSASKTAASSGSGSGNSGSSPSKTAASSAAASTPATTPSSGSGGAVPVVVGSGGTAFEGAPQTASSTQPSWGAWGGHGGRGRPTGHARVRRHLAEHARAHEGH